MVVVQIRITNGQMDGALSIKDKLRIYILSFFFNDQYGQWLTFARASYKDKAFAFPYIQHIVCSTQRTGQTTSQHVKSAEWMMKKSKEEKERTKTKGIKKD